MAIFATFALLRVFDILVPKSLERSLYDFAERHIVPEPPLSHEIVLVTIDDATFAQLAEPWPIDRSVWVRFLDKLSSCEPAVIALDVIFDQPDDNKALELGQTWFDFVAAQQCEGCEAITGYMAGELERIDSDARLSEVIANSGRVVLGAFLKEHENALVLQQSPVSWLPGLELEPPLLLRSTGNVLIPTIHDIAVSSRGTGLLNYLKDDDGIARRYPYLSAWQGRAYPSLALAAVINAHPERADSLIHRVVTLDRGAPLVRFPRRSPEVLSFIDVLDQPPERMPELRNALKGRIVIVGATATGIPDVVQTPRGQSLAGVMLHAAAASNLLLDTHLQSEKPAWLGVVLTVLILGTLFIACERISTNRLLLLMGAAVLGYLVVTYLLLVTLGWVLALIPVIGGITTLAAIEALTRLRRLQQRRRMLQERERINEAKSEFLTVVAHELRTPLTSIRGSLGLIAGGATGALPEGAQQLIHIAHDNTQRLIRLVNNVLDLQKLEAGKMEFRFEELELTALLAKTIEATRGYAQQHGVTLELTVEGSLWVHADNDLLIQAVTNLLSNAIKFSAQGEVVSLRAMEVDSWLQIAINDHGPGIPEEFRSRIFTKFAQAKTAANHPKGTGLGLNIVKSIIDGHKGEVRFDSTLGTGTTFYILLPRIEPKATAS